MLTRLAISSFSVFSAAIILSQPSNAQVVVYNNITGGADELIAGARETTANTGKLTVGDIVTLDAGTTQRTISQFELRVQSPDGAINNTEVDLFFYNVGGGNTVGTQIGSTEVRTGVNLSTGFNTITFSGLGVAVPDTFVWAATIKPSADSAKFYFYLGNVTPASGSSDATKFFSKSVNTGLSFGDSQSTEPGGFGNVEAKITAVPEPHETASVFAAVALGAVILRRIRRTGQTGVQSAAIVPLR